MWQRGEQAAASKLMGSEIEKLLHLEEHLHERVIGQDEAVQAAP